jgi:hypothetical protein
MRPLICPICFDNSLELESRGVVDIMLDRRYLEKGRVLFNLQREQETPSFKQDLINKLAEYFQWRKTLTHPMPIKKFELLSSNFYCIHKCKIDLRYKFSVIDLLISTADVRSLLEMLAKEYAIDLQIDWEEF